MPDDSDATVAALADLPRAHLHHSLPGRTRLKVPDRKNDEPYFALVENTLLEDLSILGVRANARTGSILIEHEHELDAVARRARDMGLFDLDVPVPGAPEPWDQEHDADFLEATRQRFTQVSRSLKRSTRGSADLENVIMMGLLGLAVVQAFRGQVLAPAATLLWYAGSLAAMRKVAEPIRDEGEDHPDHRASPPQG